MFEKLKSAGWKYSALGAAVFVTGLCFLFLHNSLTALTVVVGIFLSLLGAGMTCLSIFKKSKGFVFIIKIVTSTLLFTVGVLVAAFNDASFDVLLGVLCLLMIIDGSFKLQTSIKSKLLSVDGWWIITVISAAVIISAFLLARIAPGNTRGAAIWLGITALADAAGNFLSTFWTAKCKTAEKAAIYYEVYKDIESMK